MCSRDYATSVTLEVETRFGGLKGILCLTCATTMGFFCFFYISFLSALLLFREIGNSKVSI